MTFVQDDTPIILTEDAARGGVTGHHVRYVLAFGLAGVIAGFVTIAVYFGYDDLALKVSALLALDPLLVAREAMPYAAVTLAGVIAAVLLLRLWNLVAGKDDDTSQILMRIRVIVQLVVIGTIMMMYYLSHLMGGGSQI